MEANEAFIDTMGLDGCPCRFCHITQPPVMVFVPVAEDEEVEISNRNAGGLHHVEKLRAHAYSSRVEQKALVCKNDVIPGGAEIPVSPVEVLGGEAYDLQTGREGDPDDHAVSTFIPLPDYLHNLLQHRVSPHTEGLSPDLWSEPPEMIQEVVFHRDGLLHQDGLFGAADCTQSTADTGVAHENTVALHLYGIHRTGFSTHAAPYACVGAPCPPSNRLADLRIFSTGIITF